eukprot:7890984-Alexandrium_andersonii.AAC.2
MPQLPTADDPDAPYFRHAGTPPGDALGDCTQALAMQAIPALMERDLSDHRVGIPRAGPDRDCPSTMPTLRRM